LDRVERMNERIRELENQAQKFVLSIPAALDINEYTSIFNDKFAELIVQECAAIAKHNVMNISTYSDAEFVSDLINQHFGVE